MPNMYARGILFGKMVLELGDNCSAKNEKEDVSADIEFKTKASLSVTFRRLSSHSYRASSLGRITPLPGGFVTVTPKSVRFRAVGVM